MAHGEASIRIERSPEDVFAVVGDAANNPGWRTNVVRTEWLDDGPMRVGRRGRQTARLWGREWTSEAEIAEWDPPRIAGWKTVQGPVEVRSWIRIEPIDGGCLVVAGADGDLVGPLGALLARLAAPGMVRRAKTDLEGLRRQLQTGGLAS